MKERIAALQVQAEKAGPLEIKLKAIYDAINETEKDPALKKLPSLCRTFGSDELLLSVKMLIRAFVKLKPELKAQKTELQSLREQLKHMEGKCKCCEAVMAEFIEGKSGCIRLASAHLEFLREDKLIEFVELLLQQNLELVKGRGAAVARENSFLSEKHKLKQVIIGALTELDKQNKAERGIKKTKFGSRDIENLVETLKSTIATKDAALRKVRSKLTIVAEDYKIEKAFTVFGQQLVRKIEDLCELVDGLMS